MVHEVLQITLCKMSVWNLEDSLNKKPCLKLYYIIELII
jgi:hypothetical protein